MLNLFVKPLTGLLGIAFMILSVSGFYLSGTLILSAIHFFTGLIALYAFSSSQLLSHRYLIVVGLVYALMTVVGLFLRGDIFGFFTVTTVETYVHVIITVVCLIVAFGSRK
jgi:hypothetical protein